MKMSFKNGFTINIVDGEYTGYLPLILKNSDKSFVDLHINMSGDMIDVKTSNGDVSVYWASNEMGFISDKLHNEKLNKMIENIFKSKYSQKSIEELIIFIEKMGYEIFIYDEI